MNPFYYAPRFQQLTLSFCLAYRVQIGKADGTLVGAQSKERPAKNYRSH